MFIANLEDPMTPLRVLCNLEGTLVDSLENTMIKYFHKTVSPEAEPEMKVGM